MKHFCPDCDAPMSLVDGLQEQKFQYGSGEDLAILTALVPVWRCPKDDCGLELTDWKAEAIRDAIVKQHLRVNDA